MKKMSMHISNMKCEGCFSTIKSALTTNGIDRVDGNLSTRIVDVIYDEQTHSPANLIYLVEKEGYTVNRKG